MPSFETLFEESKGKPIIYKGRELHLAHYLPVDQRDSIRVTRESTSSELRQGIGLAVDGVFEVAGKHVNTELVLWEDSAPADLNIRILLRSGRQRRSRRRPAPGLLRVTNVWDTGIGVAQAWHNGAAMIVEELSSGAYRYRCNDAHPDEDFDDIVFRIERIRDRDGDELPTRS